MLLCTLYETKNQILLDMDKEEKKTINFDELTKLAENGDADAQFELGCRYYLGKRGAPINHEECVKWWTIAASNGDLSSQMNLGTIYAEGRIVTQNQENAIMWLEKAVAQGEPQAMYNLGLCYLPAPPGVPGFNKDVHMGIKYLKDAAEKGLPEAMFELAKCHLRDFPGIERDAQRGFAYMKEAAEKGFAEAQFQLAQLYNEGIGCETDYDESLKWLEKAIDQGHKKAVTMAGYVLIRHRGSNLRDNDKAIELFSKAASTGDAQAQSMLGEILLKKGLIEDAVRWFKEASEQNNQKALLMMGLFYNMGVVVPKDHGLAIQFIQRFLRVSNISSDNEDTEKHLKDMSYDLFCRLGNAALFGKMALGDFTEKNNDKAIAYFNGALELVEDEEDEEHDVPDKINAILRIASVYRDENNFGIARLLYSRAKWLALKSHNLTLYTKTVICELELLLFSGELDEAKNLVKSAYEHFENSERHLYPMDMTKPLYTNED